MDLSNWDKRELAMGVEMRICFIETGNPVLRASDAIRQGKHQMVKALDDKQHSLLEKLRELIRRLDG